MNATSWLNVTLLTNDDLDWSSFSVSLSVDSFSCDLLLLLPSNEVVLCPLRIPVKLNDGSAIGFFFKFIDDDLCVLNTSEFSVFTVRKSKLLEKEA